MQSFLKIIYPVGKVHPKYCNYIAWSCLSNIISSTENVLSAHSMLSVLGNSSNELALSVNYIGKDIVGQLGGLYYINKNGNRADREPVKFINTSLVIQESSVILECATPFLPIYTFIPLAGMANVGKNVSFTGIGAINARIIQKLAEENNVGEIYAKISVLNTLGSSVGMSLGLYLVACIPDHSIRLCLVPFFSVLRFYTYKKSLENLL